MKLRRTHVAVTTLLALALPAGARAQSFEGTVTFRTDRGGDMAYSVRQGKVRMDVNREGHQAAVIMDPGTRTMDMVMPERRMYMEVHMPDVQPGDAGDPRKDVDITKTGRTETVAGYKCEYWHIHPKDGGDDADACVSSALGNFLVAETSMQRSRMAAWEAAFGGKPVFPLKVVSNRNGHPETVMEVTKIEPKKLDASLFEPPAGFQKMTMPATGTHH